MAQYLRGWLEGKANLRPSTQQRYAGIVERDLIPAFGQQHLARLQVADVNRMLRSRRRDGLAPQSVNHLRTVLATALHDAQRQGLVGRNVASLAQRERVPHVEMRFLSAAEARVLMAAIEGQPLEPLVTVALWSGCRRGELLGLGWEDIDMDAGTLRVRRALQDRRFIETKRARSRRVIPLPRAAVMALRRQRALQAQQRLAAGSRWHDDGLVFSTSIGTPLDGSTVTKRFQSYLQQTRLPAMRFHDLRHTAAALHVQAGTPPRVLMEILGHSQISTTLNVYGHVTSDGMREAALRLDALTG